MPLTEGLAKAVAAHAKGEGVQDGTTGVPSPLSAYLKPKEVPADTEVEEEVEEAVPAEEAAEKAAAEEAVPTETAADIEEPAATSGPRAANAEAPRTPPPAPTHMTCCIRPDRVPAVPTE